MKEKILEGSWELIPEKSSEIDLLDSIALTIKHVVDGYHFTFRWGRRRYVEESFKAPLDGSPVSVPISYRVIPTNVFMGAALEPEETKTVSFRSEEDALILEEKYRLRGSQGHKEVTVINTFSKIQEDDIIRWTIKRSIRDTRLTFLMKRQGTRNAYYMKLQDDWLISSKLSRQASLISLQGTINKKGPRLYFIYPENWDFRFTPDVMEYLKNERYYSFTEIKSYEKAIPQFREEIEGYIIWDKAVRTSLIVSYTIAGLENGIVVTEDQLPLMEKLGIPQLEDLRNRFQGKSDAEIYRWAYDKYGKRCSSDLAVWLGGEHGEILKPGVADWGMYKEAFFTDLSARESDHKEYSLADEILSELNPRSLIFGWHSYKKDLEREYVTLCSKHSHRVEGLHSLPNMSFSSQIPVSPGFTFRNNHHLEDGKTYKPDKKVYIACIQTDCLGIGAWNRPGRGEMPYAWEVTMNWLWLAPSMMEFFYSQATPNDYFIGSLSGPGYMYPKVIPLNDLPKIIDIARDLMEKLDLRVFEIMDYSEGASVEGNPDLTKRVVDAYYNGMPDALGFANGYAPAYTFTVRDSIPFLSFDYYLSPERPEDQCISDIKELAELNSKRPYFLLLHVRNFSDISRVKSILDKLPEEYEIVHLDIFMKMAGDSPTFQERFLDD